GTRAAVRALDTHDLGAVGAQMVLANTYHLMLRPGAELVARMGGLHGFMAWNGPILTDSGGYQILSLEPRITEDGATFRSVYDGSMVHLRPEDAVKVQELLGPDVAMVLDVCLALPAPAERVREAMELTLRWAERALARSDSGGYQILSLEPRITEDGATFRSVYDGSMVHLRPEDAVKVQELLGPDVAMVLDVCLALPAPAERVREAMELTLRWAERALA